MIKRVVRFEFSEGNADVFISNYFPNQKQITRHTAGCDHLELWRDVDNPNLVYTYSYWESVEALNQYRESQQFREFWSAIKVLFAEPATAFSVEVLEQVD